MNITAGWLQQQSACTDQVALFRHLYPNGITVSPTTLMAAATAGLTICWLEQYIPKSRWAAYQAGCAPLLAAYEAGCAPLLAAHEVGCATLLAAYEVGRATLLAARQVGRAPLLAAYEAGRAPLLAKALRGVKGTP